MLDVRARPSADQIVAAAHGLVPRLRERARQTELDRRISPEIIDACRAAGIFRLMQPQRFGGYAYGFSDLVRVQTELASGCSSTAWAVGISALHNWLIGLFPLEAQNEIWSDPDALINGAYAPTGTCAAVSGGYRVAGSWAWASNCDHAQWFVVSAYLPKADPAGPPMAAWFLVPRAAIRIEDDWFAMGMAGTGSKTIVIDEPVFVPAHRALTVAEMNSGAAPGTSVNDDLLYRETFTGSAPFTLCSVAFGIAKGALEAFVELAKTKKTSQPGAPPALMATLAPVQAAIGEAAAIVDALELLMTRDVEEIDAVHARGTTLAKEQRVRHRRDHSFIAKESARAVGLLYDALGASGGMLSSPIQRAWRDVNLVKHHLSLSWPNVGPLFGQLVTDQPLRGTY